MCEGMTHARMCTRDTQVVALRAYTTLIYKLMNKPLRDDDRYGRGESCPLPVLTYFAVQVTSHLT